MAGLMNRNPREAVLHHDVTRRPPRDQRRWSQRMDNLRSQMMLRHAEVIVGASGSRSRHDALGNDFRVQ